jgi:hypothetical protein
MEVLHGPQPLPHSPLDSRQIHPPRQYHPPPLAMYRCRHPYLRHEPHGYTALIHHHKSHLSTHPPHKPPLTNSSRKHDSTHHALLHNSTRTLSNGCVISYSYTALDPARPLAAPLHTAPTRAPNCMPPSTRIAHSPRGELNPEHPLERLDLGG